jgi:hypothetical protein
MKGIFERPWTVHTILALVFIIPVYVAGLNKLRYLRSASYHSTVDLNSILILNDNKTI